MVDFHPLYVKQAAYYTYPENVRAAVELECGDYFQVLDALCITINDFWMSGEGHAAFKRISVAIARYWKRNIYEYFRARNNYTCSRESKGQRARPQITGNLGQACYVQLGRSGEVQVCMQKLYHTWIYRDGTARTWEYGRFLRYGTRASPGKYDPDYDCRLKDGMHPGVSTAAHWDPWMRVFKEYVRTTIIRELRKGIRRFLAQRIRRRGSLMPKQMNTHGTVLWRGAGVASPWLT